MPATRPLPLRRPSLRPYLKGCTVSARSDWLTLTNGTLKESLMGGVVSTRFDWFTLEQTRLSTLPPPPGGHPPPAWGSHNWPTRPACASQTSCHCQSDTSMSRWHTVVWWLDH